jgi:hypothetical protein
MHVGAAEEFVSGGQPSRPSANDDCLPFHSKFISKAHGRAAGSQLKKPTLSSASLLAIRCILLEWRLYPIEK